MVTYEILVIYFYTDSPPGPPTSSLRAPAQVRHAPSPPAFRCITGSVRAAAAGATFPESLGPRLPTGRTREGPRPTAQALPAAGGGLGLGLGHGGQRRTGAQTCAPRFVMLTVTRNALSESTGGNAAVRVFSKFKLSLFELGPGSRCWRQIVARLA